ncbi:nitrogenase molybdenum-iron protein subunit beta [Methanolobus bombayensis]|uniref:nitrogenase molybdenum-iron protein subunit beta n=1 Tax=Methanolobus bombayensis TaxID=38023 RepID=UPI001AEA5B56|nr:nitrogenase molybdenum-iron protein subunit beta [Methanolobus bombayensis]MBP1909753.1 nitrogenase molybdenum-iron protein beta chain [Methanolobus bombayensis]
MLDYTPKEDVQRDALVVNPAKICQPIGATYAALGIRNCMPHSHGSQGCLSYLRMCLTRHFREPTVGTTSSFYEGTAVFGGASNLKKSLANIEAVYTPEVVAIHTTCLSETIGDDVGQIIEDVEEEELIDPSIKLCAASTPSYVGTHVTGYDNMVKSFVTTFAKKTKPNGKLNVIPGFVNPGDIREIKRTLSIMNIPAIVFPDQTDVLDNGIGQERELFANGGTPIGDVEDSANSMGTIALCGLAGGAAAKVFQNKFKMPAQIGPVPIGIRFTDRFVMKAAELADVAIPPELEHERSRVVDMMTDAHPHFYGKKVAIFGDPDIIEGLTSLVLEMGMEPTVILSGTVSKAFEERVSEMVHPLYPDSQILTGADLFTLHQIIKNEPVDMLIGNTYGKHIALAENIPLIRVGFPVMDRANLHHFPVMGYAGAARMIEWIGNTFLDIKDKTVPEEELEVVQ